MENHNHKIYISNYNKIFALMHILLFSGISANALFLIFTVNNLDSKNPYLVSGIICIIISIVNILIGYIGYTVLKKKEQELKILIKKKKYQNDVVLPSYISIIFIIISSIIFIVTIIHLFTRYSKNKKHFIFFHSKNFSI